MSAPYAARWGPAASVRASQAASPWPIRRALIDAALSAGAVDRAAAQGASALANAIGVTLTAQALVAANADLAVARTGLRSRLTPPILPSQHLAGLVELRYTTTFGETFEVTRTSDPGRFRLFEIEGLPGLLVPSPAPTPMESAPLEEVVFLRDEVANLAWAIERVVTGPSGAARTRADEAAPASAPAGTGLAELAYQLQTTVPAHWIPFVPVALSTGGVIELRKGAMTGEQGDVLPLGVLLRGAAPVHLNDEEVPREGVQVRRVAALVRRPDGSYARWTARRVGVSFGEGSSALAFDAVMPGRL